MTTKPTNMPPKRPLDREPSDAIVPVMSPARCGGFAQLATTIGAIPGCSLGGFSIGPFSGPDGTTRITLNVRGRGPALNHSVMEWTARVDLSGTTADTIAAALIHSFKQRIDRQRARAQEDIDTHGRPLPWIIHETVTGALHLAIDRMTLWAIHRTLLQNPIHMSSDRILQTKPTPEAVRNYASLITARVANRAINDIPDRGGTSLSDGGNQPIKEIKTPAGIRRQVAHNHVLGNAIICGNTIILTDVTLPNTLILGVAGKPFCQLADISKPLGAGLANLIAQRRIKRIKNDGRSIHVELEPDPVLINDINQMTINEITGEG